MLNSQVYCELGTMIPTTGGDYDYLLRAYGSQAAFSFAFFNFFISKTGSQAIIATIFGRYFSAAIYSMNATFRDQELNGESVTTKLAAVACIVVLTALNCAGIRESATVQACLTGLKLLLVLVLFISAMAYASRDPSIIVANLSYATAFQGTKGIFGFGSAMVSCLWSYDGYCDLNFLMEELQEPDKHLPQVVMSSLAIVTVAYVCANVAYFAVLSSDAIIASKSVAVDMGEKVGGLAVASFFALGVVVSTAGSNNGSIMTGGRAFYAVGRGGHAPVFLSYLNKNNAPYMALLAQGSWTLFLLLIPGSNFSSLLDYFGPASWFFYALSSSGTVVCVLIYMNNRLIITHLIFSTPTCPLQLTTTPYTLSLLIDLHAYQHILSSPTCFLQITRIVSLDCFAVQRATHRASVSHTVVSATTIRYLFYTSQHNLSMLIIITSSRLAV